MKVVLLFVLFLGWHPVTGHLRRSSIPEQTSDVASKEEEVPQQPTKRRLGSETQQLLSAFQFAKAIMLEKLKEDYGEEFYSLVFEDDARLPTKNQTSRQLDDSPMTTTTTTTTSTTIGRHAFLKTANAMQSWERIKRKFMMRILKYQITGTPTPFVWATAGDQVAAGRGNFFDQQYTQVMEKAIHHVMQVVGIDFKTRPYGMGGLHSAPEIAACVKAIFGEDVDLVSWDFSAADAHHAWRLEYFAHRVMRMDNRPALLVLRADSTRQPIVEHLTDLGMGILAADESYVDGRMEHFPDSTELTEEEIYALPELVRWFKCRNMIEAGRGCMRNKFTKNGTCDDRPWRTSWHPGWYVVALLC